MTLATGLVACSSDDFLDGYEGSSSSSISKEKVEVTLNIGVQESEELTRAWDGEQSANETHENMYSWFVIVVQNSTVVDIVEKSSVPDLEQDELKLELTTGTYGFYSFANIDRSDISALASLTEGSTMPDLSTVTYTVNGNGFEPSASNPIPMSNYQSITIDSSTTEVSLWVVRMLAKMTLQFSNVTAEDIVINSVTLSEVTDNVANNLMLMPDPTGYADTGACTPNLNTSAATTTDFTYTPSNAVTIASNGTADLTFYVNESVKPTQNAHELFTLSVNCGDGTTYYRYALITNDDDNWDFIARNDHRVIPITLQEYYLDIELYDWPPIGVYSSIEKGEDGLFTATFHAAGHFHIVPVVKKYGSDTALSYGTGTDEWSFSSWTTVGTIPDDFYEEDTSSTVDECENGGVPIWSETNQFIFGYLKDTGTGNAETKAYHDLVIYVHTSDGTTRTLTYHLCIVKDLAY